jgi:hypothetical protein
MLKSALLTFTLATTLGLGFTASAKADLIVVPTFDPSNQAAPPDATDYEGNYYDLSSTFPPNPITIGTFTFTVPTGQVITGATISGTFGDQNIPVTALADLFVDGGTIEVGNCDSTSDPCFSGTIGGSPVPWSHPFTAAELGDLTGGTLDLIAVQNSFGAVFVGAPTLDIQTTPEPASIFTLAGGLLALAAWRRRK